MVTRQDLINLLIEVRPILEDKKALQYMEMYPLWQSDLSVKVNERYQYNGRLYKVVQAHTTQADWTPDVTPALWVKVSLEEWTEWIQPTGSHDAYAKDAKVTHNDKKWTSDVDANVWEPGVYGWTEYVEEV